MPHTIIFDRNLFGNRINDVHYDGKNIRQISNDEVVNSDFYLNSEEIKIINQLFCLERIGFPSNKWLNIYKTLNGKKNNNSSIPWIHFLKREDFKNEVQSYIQNVYNEIDKIDQEYYLPVKNFFKAYIVDEELRDIIKTKELARLNHCASFDFSDYEKLGGFESAVPDYIRDYASQLVGI